MNPNEFSHFRHENRIGSPAPGIIVQVEMCACLCCFWWLVMDHMSNYIAEKKTKENNNASLAI